MSNADISMQAVQIVLPKVFVDQPHPLSAQDLSLRAGGVTHRNPAALLSPVLKCQQTIVDRRRNILLRGEIIHAKDTAFLTGFIQDRRFVKYSRFCILQFFYPVSGSVPNLLQTLIRLIQKQSAL